MFLLFLLLIGELSWVELRGKKGRKKERMHEPRMNQAGMTGISSLLRGILRLPSLSTLESTQSVRGMNE